MINLLSTLADRLLSVVVPKGVASACACGDCYCSSDHCNIDPLRMRYCTNCQCDIVSAYCQFC
jgi:hypothetical protein